MNEELPAGAARASRKRMTLLTCVSWAVMCGAIAACASGRLERVEPNDNRIAAGHLRNGELRVALEVRRARWYPEADDGPSVPVLAFAEVGGPPRIPGPLIRVRSGTRVVVVVRNTLLDSAVVLHGIGSHPTGALDTLSMSAGGSAEVRFVAGSPGTYAYWARVPGLKATRPGLGGPLAGALIVDPASPAPAQEDRIFVIGYHHRPGSSLSECPDLLVRRAYIVCRVRGRIGHKLIPSKFAEDIMTVNGKSWPYTERLEYPEGDSVHWRVVNVSDANSHPMHLHGFYFAVMSRGTLTHDTVYEPDQRPLAVTESMPDSSTMTLAWLPDRPGNWLFHCHFAFHISDLLFQAPARRKGLVVHPLTAKDTGHGMEGLVLGVRVRPTVEARREVDGPRRPIRLIVQSIPTREGHAPWLGYVQQRGDQEPSRDSIEVPGPTLVLRRGEPVAITVVNHLAEHTTVHWHGIELDAREGGVPGWTGLSGSTTVPISPGDSVVSTFTPPRAGTFIYHSHTDDIRQVTSGLYGALLVVEPGVVRDTVHDRVIVLSQAGPGSLGKIALVNGLRSPTPLQLRVGERYRLRLVSIAEDIMFRLSLHDADGLARWRPLAKDGADIPSAQATWRPARLTAGPGETVDIELAPATVGMLRLDVAGPALASPVSVMMPVGNDARRIRRKP